MEYPGVGFAGTAFLAGYFHLVVRGRIGFLDIAYFGEYVDHPVGRGLQQRTRSAEGKQKPLFCKARRVIR